MSTAPKRTSQEYAATPEYPFPTLEIAEKV